MPELSTNKRPPVRFTRPAPAQVIGVVAFLALFVWSMRAVDFSLVELVRDGIPNMYGLLREMFPPEISTFRRVGLALVETLQIAAVGALVGVVCSLPCAILATRSFTPHPICFHAMRFCIQLFRVVPAVIWAVIFVASVGLGAFSGALTVIVSTIGFCGRFFAEAMDDVEKGPQEALMAIGSPTMGVIFSAVLPAALPSFLNTMSFTFERAVRSSAVLGLVGAGGIGFLLTEAMNMFMWRRAALIILCMLVLVALVERLSAALRTNMLHE